MTPRSSEERQEPGFDQGQEAVWYGKDHYGPNRMGLLDNTPELGLVYRMPGRSRRRSGRKSWLLGFMTLPALAWLLAMVVFWGGGEPASVIPAPRETHAASPPIQPVPPVPTPVPMRRVSQPIPPQPAPSPQAG
ncbi:MAG: hypothetical protein HQL82_12370 [Magnetococcales bacterium]|nr:hypothetical protein [Magnetococcales bacterium]